ncbi:basic-leucine zipper transcription factor A [Drosophila obscura]|uniref:basic-leucine zipper transcription factor A n=1 Tax=Drosophila obscura TaxID=7282 RepID=UPI001BB223CE|nr:basic-leucine zipper transcription factor A [Drosophila obscura]
MKRDVLRLIAEVRPRRALWDTSIRLSNRKDEWATQWLDVSAKLQLDVISCKKRFKGLRDSYRSEIRKIQQGRIEMSNWTYFRPLEFLRIIFDPTGLVGFEPEDYEFDFESAECSNDYDQTHMDDFIIDLDNDDSVDFEIMGDIFKRDSPEQQDSGSDMSLMKPLDSGSDMSLMKRLDMSMANRSDMELSPRLLSPLHQPVNHSMLPRPPPTKRNRRRKTSSSYDGPISNGYCHNNSNNNNNSQTTHVAETPPPAASSQSTVASKDDADYNFLVSLMPHMKSLSDMGNLKFRMEISRILVELKKEETTPARNDAAVRPQYSPATMPKLTPAPAAQRSSLQQHQRQQQQQQQQQQQHQHQHSDPEKYFIPNSYLNGYVDSSMVECDVKIENEPLL